MSANKQVYCGANAKAPKGRKRGTLKECTEKGQVRRWGRKKADTIKFEEYKLAKNKKVNPEKLRVQLFTIRGKLAKMEREYPYEKDPEKKKKMKDDYNVLKEEAQKLDDQIDELEKTGSGIKMKGVVWKGGKISAKLLKELFEKDDFKDVPPYILDKELSTEWVRVLHDPKSKHTIVVHRGSADLYDAWVDFQLGLGYKNNKRFKESKRIQEAAQAKYGTDNMSVIGSSLGGTLASEYGKDAKEIITSGRPITPLDLILGKKPHETQHDVRTHTDIVSFLKVLQPHQNDITVKSIDHLNPIKSHLGRHTMEAVQKEHGKDVEIGEEGVGLDKEGGEVAIAYASVMKMNAKDLKKFIVRNRRYTNDYKTNKYKVTGMKKKELKELATELWKNMKK